jgi:hypothetical protein
MSWSPYDPYSFFGHLDRDVFIALILCGLSILLYVFYNNVFLLILGGIGFVGVIIVQVVRNYRRRIRYKYAPESLPTSHV